MSSVEDLKNRLDTLVAEINTPPPAQESEQKLRKRPRWLAVSSLTGSLFGLRFARWGSLAALGFVLAAISWYSDSALLTLRVALNFTNGWGDSFNYLDAAQTPTSSLWVALWGIVGLATGEWVLTMTVLSVAFAVAAFGVVLYAARGVPQVLFAAAALLLSGWIMEYSVSGSEVPLALLSVGVFYLLAIKTLRHGGRETATLLGFVGAAAFMVNPTLVLIVTPAIVCVAVARRSDKTEVALLVAAFVVPAGTHMLWSTIVFGAPLPLQTMTALRSLGDVDLLTDGAQYLWLSATKSPVSAFVVLAGSLYVAIKGGALHRTLVAGSLLALTLVAFAGGNENLGELTVVPTYTILLAAVATAAATPPHRHRVSRSAAVVAFVGCAALTFWQTPPAGVTPQHAPRWDSDTTAGYVDTRNQSVAQGRSVPEMALGTTRPFPQVQPLQTVPTIKGTFAEGNGIALRDIARAASEWPNRQTGDDMPPSGVGTACANLGVYAIMTGPQAYWVDTCGRTDSFTAGQPTVSSSGGLRERDVPDDYITAQQKNRTTDVSATNPENGQR